MLQLDDWQKDILAHEGHLLLCTGRQVGKTTVFAIKAAEYMIKHPKSRIIVVSLTEDQAELIIVMTLTYLEQNHKSKLKKGQKNITKKKIVLKNKSQILARPVGQTGDAVRGFTGDVLIIDEASKMPESVFTAAKPTLLTTGGKIWMCSTPHGRTGYFYKCFIKPKRYKVFHISSEEVIYNRPISESWSKQRREEAIRDLEEEKEDMSELEYAQEFLGKFIDDLRQLFSDEWIERVCTAKRQDGKKGDFFLGCDIARMGGDSLTFEILQRIGDNIIQRENICQTFKLTTYTFDKIKELDKMWNFRDKGIGIDAGSGSLGVTIFDFLLREPLLDRKVVAINNLTRNLDRWGQKKKQIMKVDLYNNLLALGEQGKIQLLNDPNLKLSLKSVQYEHVVKEGLPTQTRIFGRDTHIAEGLTRAAWLANQKLLNIHILSIKHVQS